MDHARIDEHRLANIAEIQRLLDHRIGILVSAAQLARTDQPAILTGNTNRQRARRVNQPRHLLIDRAGEHHLHHLDHGGIRNPQPLHEIGLDIETLQHGVDLRPAAMHHHRVDADLLEQRDIAAELIGQRAIHGVAAIFHHDRRPGIAAQIRQHFGDDMRFPGCVCDVFAVHLVLIQRIRQWRPAAPRCQARPRWKW